MPTTLEWFGTATFRVHADSLDLFFDAYLDRLPGLEPVGLSTAQVDRADFVFVSHAHFDHLYGADAVALRTGATVVSSPESARCLRALGVPDEQLLVVTGGETVHCGPTTRVRVLPALHSCLFAHGESDTALPCMGDLGVSAQERAAAVRGLFGVMGAVPPPAGPALVRDERGVLCARRRPARLSADDGRWLRPGERQRGLLARHLRRAASGRGPPLARGQAERRRGAVPGFLGSVHARAGAAPPTRTGCLLPPRPALPGIAGRGHRCRRRRAPRARRRGVLRGGVRLTGRPFSTEIPGLRAGTTSTPSR